MNDRNYILTDETIEYQGHIYVTEMNDVCKSECDANNEEND